MTRAHTPIQALPSWDISLSISINSMAANNTDLENSSSTATSPAATASTWLPHGSSEQGFLFLPDHPTQQVRAKYPPSIATYRGQLWAVWTGFDDVTYYASTTPESHGDAFGAAAYFPVVPPNTTTARIPVLANLNGVLHAILVTKSTGQITHWIYEPDDDQQQHQTWRLQPNGEPLCHIVCGSLIHTDSGDASSHDSPLAVVAFHNKLFLVYLSSDSTLHYAIFDAANSCWTNPAPVTDADGHPLRDAAAAPALFVRNGDLLLLAASRPSTSHTPSAHIIHAYRYDDAHGKWLATESPIPEGKVITTSGISTASFGGSAYFSFLDNVGSALVAGSHTNHNNDNDDDDAWQDAERVGGKSVKARFAPRIAVRNGRVHCLFAGKWVGAVHWFSRPAVAGLDLAGWMGAISDGDTMPLSALTIPGTHDSCARSEVPFVRTQYLSITQQLALGIRFFDLRLRRHDDGKLYCYHGGVPIGLPGRLSFAQVMEEVWAFIGPKEGNNCKPTETVLISINNDDKGKDQKQYPQAFYHAVQEAIESTPCYENGSSRWYTAPVTPKLDQVRGKAVLLRRFYGDPDVEPTQRMGLDLEKWLDNNPDFSIITPNGVRVRLQDKWKYSKRCGLEELIASKQAFVQKMMRRAAGLEADDDDDDNDDNENCARDPAETWYINFCSAVGDPVEHGEVAQAKWIAVGARSDYHFFGGWVEGMNVRTRNYLRGLGPGKKRLGIVNLDYPELPEDSDLVARLIETNF